MTPGLFIAALGLHDGGGGLAWAMRMLGVTVFALAGNMFQHSKNALGGSLQVVSWLMCFSAGALGLLTLLIPTRITPFCALYAAVGFGFSLAYLFNLLVRGGGSTVDPLDTAKPFTELES